MNFLRVLIVDDDATVRIGLKTLIAWEQYGYRLVGEAVDGRQAIEITRRERPHIVITDMKMPVMDGLTLIKTLKDEGFTGAFLVLSSYDDFELVKGAMKLGAADYFLKLELDDRILLNCLDEIRKKHDFSDLAGSLDPAGGGPAPQSRIIRNIICNFYSTEEELFRQLRLGGIHFDTSSIYCFFIKISSTLPFEEGTEEEYHTLNLSIINVVSEISGDCFKAYCTGGKTGEFYVIAGARKNLQNENEEELAALTARRLHEMLWQYLNLDCTIGVSQGALTLTGLRDACHQAVEAAESRYYLKNDGVIIWKDCPKPIQKGFLSSDRVEILKAKQELKHGLEALQEEKTDASLLRFKSIIAEPADSREAILCILLEVFICVREVFDRYSISPAAMLPRSWRTYTDFLIIGDIPQAARWIDGLREDLRDYIRGEIKKEYLNVVLKAKDMIDQNYSSKLSLPDLAMSVHLDPSYLSSLMRKHLGMTYSQYLTSVRMNHAKQLLADSSDKISAVAETVGYPDQFYFSRLFKRIYGLTPGEYRKRKFIQHAGGGNQT